MKHPTTVAVRRWTLTAAALTLTTLSAVAAPSAPDDPADGAPRPLRVLFLGHESTHHDSARFAPLLAQAVAKRGIWIDYSADPADLSAEVLGLYDALLIYANHDTITSEQERALLDFVAEGGGFLPIHSASYCFRNSAAYVELVGAQFHEHGVGTFSAEIVDSEHEITRGLDPIETWDETYVHTRHNPDRHLLMERVDRDDRGDRREPWTWTRRHGEGRVFYTAYGHDRRTWSHPGFLQLLERAIVWSVSEEARSLWQRLDLEPHRYRPAEIPNYERRDPPPRLQEPFSPESSQSHIQVPAGFELELFAAEPDLHNPIAMAWDERGRLFVLETIDYPNRQDLENGSDRLTLVEDKDGDGRADSFVVFAEGLSIPTSVAVAHDGVIVSQAPHFLYLADTDGDDRADVRRVLSSAWGTYDTHAGPSNLRFGIDNWLWGTVGYSGFRGEVAGEEHRFGQAVYRFRTDTRTLTELEVVSSFTNNTWGLGFSEDFEVFGSTANNEHSVFVAIPERFYDGVPGLSGVGRRKIDGHYAMRTVTPNVRQVDSHGGFTAAAGHALYTARAFPPEYWNRIALVSEPTGHLLHLAVLEPDGSGFRERDGWNLLASADEWVSPVAAEVGPDGAVWVLDWYNFIVQHNPTPEGFETGKGNAYENPLRDRQHGRIYRIVHRDAPESGPMALSKERPQELVAALDNDNLFWRLTAQRLLVERGEADVVPALVERARAQRLDSIGLDAGALHALWTLHGLGALTEPHTPARDAAEDALSHPSAAVRKSALRVLPRDGTTLAAVEASGVLADASGVLADASGVPADTELAVLRVAFLAASELPPSQELGRALYEMSESPAIRDDDWLPEALYLAAHRHRAGFLDAYAADLGVEQLIELAVRLERGDLDAGVDLSAPDLDDSEWKTMAVPRRWAETELAEFDGAAWFRYAFELPEASHHLTGRLHLGEINDSDTTYLNGVRIGGFENDMERVRDYEVPPGLILGGRNVVAVRVVDHLGRGGIYDQPENTFLEAGKERYSLAGTWRYRIEETYWAGKRPDLPRDVPLAQSFLRHHNPVTGLLDSGSGIGGPRINSDREASQQEPDVTLALATLPGENRFNVASFSVRAKQRVRIRFDNNDDIQHNVLILRPDSLEEVGAELDDRLDDPDASEKAFIPTSDHVLYGLPLLEAGEVATLTFTAPSQPGDYPFVCTFPGHWRTMQGVLRVLPERRRR